MEDHDDNIFDQDDALDYVLYEDSEKDFHRPQRRAGCLSVLAMLIIPVAAILNFSVAI